MKIFKGSFRGSIGAYRGFFERVPRRVRVEVQVPALGVGIGFGVVQGLGPCKGSYKHEDELASHGVGQSSAQNKPH